VTGKTPSIERDRLITQYRRGELRALTNANVLTVGFDVPDTDMLIMLRPTQSPGLYVQMVGRGSRIAPGKANCLILDFAGNAMRHGPVDQIEAWTPRPSERGDAPSKTCPDCETICATAVRICPECGYQFPFDETPKHEAHASNAPILSTDIAPVIERHPVVSVDYQYHEGRDGKRPTLKVTYRGPLMRIASEWICFEHEGYARSKAVAWWVLRAPGTPVPSTIDEAEQRAPDEVRKPVAIRVNTRPKYPEIVGYEWQEQTDVEVRHAA
jgi:DNA repair protein RadD